jgi:uncharacterized YigZ family protein
VYTTLKTEARHSEIVKNSEFLAFAAPVSNVEAALVFVAGLRSRYMDASHVCWAYRVGAQYRFSDDGEPSGTAGAPMYRSLEMSGLDGVVVAVVRYYGGVNLGAGGLVRAYGGAAAEVLRVAERLEVHPRVAVTVRVGFDATSSLYRLLEGFDVQARTDEFVEHGLEVRFAVLESELDALRVAVRDATRGQGEVVAETSHDDAA